MGSISESPTIPPLALIEPASLQFAVDDSRAPKSVTTPLCDSNPWKTFGTRPSGPPQTKKSLVDEVATDVAEPPTTFPRVFRGGKMLTDSLMKLSGPPNVPM